MRHWTYWEWVAYACIWVAAIILAADTGLRVSPELATHAPAFVHGTYWGFAPLGLVFLGTLILVASNFGWLDGLFGFRQPLHLFLERDSLSDQFGIQSFPQISYVQLSILARAPVTKCRAWSTRVEYSPDNLVPYALEHGERHPLPWSKHRGPNVFEADHNPGDPPLRLNVAVIHNNVIEFDPLTQTPTNLAPLFQRVGFHRLIIIFTASKRGVQISQTCHLAINWRGSSHAIVKMEE